MKDDWKGEHHIRNYKPTMAERQSAGMSAISSIAAEKRRRAGIPPNGQKNHWGFVKDVFKDLRKGGDV